MFVYRIIIRYLYGIIIMIAVITGDIINSKQGKVDEWLVPLKNALLRYGQSPIDWEIFRGDSFQLALKPAQAFGAATHIKSVIKISKQHDVRLAIGIGEVTHHSSQITEANGTAYSHSGEAFALLKKQALAIKTSNNEWDKGMNLMFKLALLAADHWSPVVANVIRTALENNEKSQQELAQMLGRSQSVISATLSRGGYDEIMELNQYYQQQISVVC